MKKSTISKTKGASRVAHQRLVMPPDKLEAFIRNPKTVWYGPHQCHGCGAEIVKSSNESGGVALDAPHNHHYPNHEWTHHKCQKARAKRDGRVRSNPLFWARWKRTKTKARALRQNSGKGQTRDSSL